MGRDLTKEESNVDSPFVTKTIKTTTVTKKKQYKTKSPIFIKKCCLTKRNKKSESTRFRLNGH